MTSPRCPCGLGEPFAACCGRHLGPDGTAAPTAEALMRSRYTAFVRGDGVQHERSRFVRDAGRWVYLDGAVTP